MSDYPNVPMMNYTKIDLKQTRCHLIDKMSKINLKRTYFQQLNTAYCTQANLRPQKVQLSPYNKGTYQVTQAQNSRNQAQMVTHSHTKTKWLKSGQPVDDGPADAANGKPEAPARYSRLINRSLCAMQQTCRLMPLRDAANL